MLKYFSHYIMKTLSVCLIIKSNINYILKCVYILSERVDGCVMTQHFTYNPKNLSLVSSPRA